jgi:hypothetical protein
MNTSIFKRFLLDKMNKMENVVLEDDRTSIIGLRQGLQR